MPPLRQTITSTRASTKKFRTNTTCIIGWLMPAVFVATPMTEMKNIANTMSKMPLVAGVMPLPSAD